MTDGNYLVQIKEPFIIDYIDGGKSHNVKTIVGLNYTATIKNGDMYFSSSDYHWREDFKIFTNKIPKRKVEVVYEFERDKSTNVWRRKND